MAFDQTNVYVSFRVWESQPDRMIVNEMRRDSTQNILQNEAVAFILDTYYDRRNGVLFHINAIGGRLDGQVTDERQYNSDWNPIWDYATGRFDGGWTLEAAVPFKSLRYRPGTGAGLGFERPPHQPVEERDLVRDPRPERIRHTRHLSGVRSRHTRRHRGSTRGPQPRAQTICDIRSDNGYHRLSRYPQ